MASTIHLLSDQPTTQDAFGTHNRVATAIAELIRTEKPGKAIALIGPWGSGKSSVLQMLRARLADIADVFIFDAWTHEGDPLRRTFLQTLIHSLWPTNTPGEVKKLHDGIALRKKTTEETTFPLLSWEARVLGILLLIVPAGLAMFSAMVRLRTPSWPLVTLALGLALMPILFLLLLAFGSGLSRVLRLISRAPTKKLGYLVIGELIGLILIGLWFGIKSHELIIGGFIFLVAACLFVMTVLLNQRSTSPDVLPILLNRTVTTTRSESIESAEPSSVEFQGWFRSIVEMHSKDKGRQLVIAVDNLDRIDPALARQIWATMRTFFEPSSDAQPQEERIWLLAAFDRGAVRNLWEVKDPDLFIKKTFQASFSIPTLVLIHRDDYLKKQLTAAFPFCGSPLLDPIVRLYALKHSGEISTPRSIISFVNSIGSIHRQWPIDKIPLVQQALYLLAIEDAADAEIMTIIASASNSSWSPEELVGPNWQESLAAIHFNVPPLEVAHVFMPPAIISGLLSGDVTKFADLAKIRGFGGILSEVAFNNKEAWKQPQSLANAIVALNSLHHDENDDGINRTWRILTTAASRIERWEALPQTGDTLSILIKRSANDNGQIMRLLSSAGRAITRTPDGSVDNSEEGLTRFIKALAPVIDLLAVLPANFQMIIYGSATTYLFLLNILSRMKSEQFAETARHLDTESRDEIPGALGELIRTVQLKADFSPVIKAVSVHYPELDWRPAVEAVEYLFGNTNNNFFQTGYKSALETMLVLARPDSSAAKSLGNLASSGTLYHYLGVADDRGSKDLALLLLLLFADASEPAVLPGKARAGFTDFKIWLEGPDSASLGVIAGLVVKFGQKGRLKSRESLPHPVNKELLNVLKILAERTEMSDGG